MRLRHTRRWACALALALSSATVLTGCGAQPEPPSTPPAKTADANPPAEETEPAPEPIVLPACDAMNATAQQEYEEFGVEMFAEPAGETDLAAFTEFSGPVAQEAMAAAEQQRGCRWPIHSQGTVIEYVAELPHDAQAPLIAALRSDTTVTEAALDAAASFSYESPAPNGYMSATEITHLFIGDVWIAVFDTAGDRAYAPAALEAVMSANPSLADAAADADAGSDADPDEPQGAAQAAGACASSDGLTMLAASAPNVPGGPWDVTGQFSDVSGYDPCAALSWIVLRPEPCCTRFSITPVLFFHQGELVPSATVAQYAIDTTAPPARASESSVALTFMWPGSDFAGPANTATSTFTWDAATSSVARSGDLPPS